MPKRRRRPYEELRAAVEERGGTMTWRRRGHRYGAWIVAAGGRSEAFPSEGGRFPGLDELYKPKPGISNPSHWGDYSRVLQDGATDRLLRSLRQRS